MTCRPLLAVMLVGALLVPCRSALSDRDDSFTLSWSAQPRTETYHAPSRGALRTAEALWLDLFERGQLETSQRQAWRQLGFEARQAGELIGFRELEARGWGSYFVHLGRLTKANEGLMLQVPHRYHDRHTGPIGWRWWKNDFRVAALAINTAPRSAADLGQLNDSMLLAFTRAFLSAQGSNSQIVQLHGFAAEKRQTDRGKEAELIISAGHRKPSKKLVSMVNCLQQADFAARLYPSEVAELGGTRNRVGRMLRRRDLNNFVHLEIDALLRERLIDKADDSLGRLCACW